MTLTDAQLRDQAMAELAQTTVGRINSKWKVPPAGTHWANAEALLAQIGAVAPPPPPPPPGGWTVAKPGSTQPPVKVTTINNPVGAGVNIHTAPATVTDTIVVAGQDQAFLVQGGQGGGAGSTFERIQGNLVGGYSVPGNNKHFFYVKGARVTVLDAAATAATSPHTGDGGFSVRYAGFLAERFTLDGFQLPLNVFADDETPGTVVWRQGRVTNPRDTPVYLDCDEAAKMVFDVVCDRVDFFDWSGPVFVANTANFAGTLTITGCTVQGRPVTAADVRGVPGSRLAVSP